MDVNVLQDPRIGLFGLVGNQIEGLQLPQESIFQPTRAMAGRNGAHKLPNQENLDLNLGLNLVSKLDFEPVLNPLGCCWFLSLFLRRARVATQRNGLGTRFSLDFNLGSNLEPGF